MSSLWTRVSMSTVEVKVFELVDKSSQVFYEVSIIFYQFGLYLLF